MNADDLNRITVDVDLSEQMRAAAMRRDREARELRAEIRKGAIAGGIFLLGLLVGLCLAT